MGSSIKSTAGPLAFEYAFNQETRTTSHAYIIPKLKRDNPELAAKVVAPPGPSPHNFAGARAGWNFWENNQGSKNLGQLLLFRRGGIMQACCTGVRAFLRALVRWVNRVISVHLPVAGSHGIRR